MPMVTSSVQALEWSLPFERPIRKGRVRDSDLSP